MAKDPRKNVLQNHLVSGGFDDDDDASVVVSELLDALVSETKDLRCKMNRCRLMKPARKFLVASISEFVFATTKILPCKRVRETGLLRRAIVLFFVN